MLHLLIQLLKNYENGSYEINTSYITSIISCRLYTKGIVLGYKRSLRSQDPNTSLLKIEGVNDKKDTDFYLGKRVAYVYRAHKKREAKGKKPASKIRCIWGKVTRPHGNSGVVRAKFRHNLPPKCFGATVRVVSNKIFNYQFRCYNYS